MNDGSLRISDPLVPRLRGRDVLALTVGIVIGAGVFATPALAAGAAASPTMLILAWIAGGLLSIVGALCYAELASAFPSVGGDYHFLDLAYGRRLAFLYAWARLTVIQTGSLALLAYVFGDYLAAVAPAGPFASTLYAAAAVVAITGVNWLGLRQGFATQLWLVLIEVAGLVFVIVAGLAAEPAAGAAPAVTTGTGAGGLGLMLVFVLLTYGGWSEAAYLSGEFGGDRRRFAALMVGGLAIVTALYVLVNLAFLNALGLAGMAASEAVATDTVRRTAGAGGAAVLAIAVAVAALTSANATAITGARTAAALGERFARLGWLARWNDARATPGNALLAQGALALVLVAAGGFARDGFRLAVEFTAPVFWFFLLLVGISLFVLRRRRPDAARPFRVPLYPVLPALFCATSAYLLWSSVAYTGAGALAGVAVLGVGAALLPLLSPKNGPSQHDRPHLERSMP